jgi:hypothetical protein
MMNEFDWPGAEEALNRLSKEQFARFLERVDRCDLYGLGFFCDPIEGVMPAANTRSFHAACFREYVGGVGGPTRRRSGGTPATGNTRRVWRPRPRS